MANMEDLFSHVMFTSLQRSEASRFCRLRTVEASLATSLAGGGQTTLFSWAFGAGTHQVNVNGKLRL